MWVFERDFSSDERVKSVRINIGFYVGAEFKSQLYTTDWHVACNVVSHLNGGEGDINLLRCCRPVW